MDRATEPPTQQKLLSPCGVLEATELSDIHMVLIAALAPIRTAALDSSDELEARITTLDEPVPGMFETLGEIEVQSELMNRLREEIRPFNDKLTDIAVAREPEGVLALTALQEIHSQPPWPVPKTRLERVESVVSITDERTVTLNEPVTGVLQPIKLLTPAASDP